MVSKSTALVLSLATPPLIKASTVPHRRHLQLYPECAVLQDDAYRRICCDDAVQSVAGRDFCFSQVIRAEGTFDECKDQNDNGELSPESIVKVFKCCDILAEQD